MNDQEGLKQIIRNLKRDSHLVMAIAHGWDNQAESLLIMQVG